MANRIAKTTHDHAMNAEPPIVRFQVAVPNRRPVMPVVKCQDCRMAGVAERSPSPGAARRQDLPVAP